MVLFHILICYLEHNALWSRLGAQHKWPLSPSVNHCCDTSLTPTSCFRSTGPWSAPLLGLSWASAGKLLPAADLEVLKLLLCWSGSVRAVDVLICCPPVLRMGQVRWGVGRGGEVNTLIMKAKVEVSNISTQHGNISLDSNEYWLSQDFHFQIVRSPFWF